MKQVLQNLRTGLTEVVDVPCPQGQPGQCLIQTRASLISAGTERMLVEFSQANLLQKARQQPDKVKQVLDKIRTDGLLPTLDAVFRRLDVPLPLGYCNAGVAVASPGPPPSVGLRIEAGDRVVSNGRHAEMVSVPKNLCAKVPDGVSDEEAAFTVLGAIALQGIRLAQPALGETFVVFGLGLVGLLTVQLLRANGCKVIGIDLNSERVGLAETFGALPVDVSNGADPVRAVSSATDGVGVDGVLITASAKTDEIVHQAAEACRKRGRIVLVGVVGLNLRRSDFYGKELTFQVSCSYGPGRYDESYEQKGQDYPVGYVRWTEQRNFEAVLAMLASGRLNVKPLITHRFKLEDAVQAYEQIQSDPGALGVILEYGEQVDFSPRVQMGAGLRLDSSLVRPRIGVIGAGNFAKATLLPALAKTDADLRYVADLDPVAARHAGSKFGAKEAVTDYTILLKDPEVDAVCVLVGHNLHARFVCEALRAGKHVHVEKPLAMNEAELGEIESTLSATGEGGASRMLLLGFNRRFSPHTQKVKALLAGHSGPLCMTMTANAGAIPADHWVHDPERGGGRIIGEACHYIDLMAFLAGALVTSVAAAQVGAEGETCEDKMSILLTFADGSVGTVNYFANGAKSYPKELLDVFTDDRVLRIENFRVTRGYGFKGFRSLKTRRQDKGHGAEMAAFIGRIAEGGEPLMSFDEMANVTRASFAAVTAARERRVIQL